MFISAVDVPLDLASAGNAPIVGKKRSRKSQRKPSMSRWQQLFALMWQAGVHLSVPSSAFESHVEALNGDRQEHSMICLLNQLLPKPPPTAGRCVTTGKVGAFSDS